jgi:hypothetical protein
MTRQLMNQLAQVFGENYVHVPMKELEEWLSMNATELHSEKWQ